MKKPDYKKNKERDMIGAAIIIVVAVVVTILACCKTSGNWSRAEDEPDTKEKS